MPYPERHAIDLTRRDYAGVTAQHRYIDTEAIVLLIQYISTPEGGFPGIRLIGERESKIDQVHLIVLELRVEVLVQEKFVDVIVFHPGNTNEVRGQLGIVLEGSYARFLSGESKNPNHEFFGFVVDQLMLRARRFAV